MFGVFMQDLVENSVWWMQKSSRRYVRHYISQVVEAKVLTELMKIVVCFLEINGRIPKVDDIPSDKSVSIRVWSPIRVSKSL